MLNCASVTFTLTIVVDGTRGEAKGGKRRGLEAHGREVDLLRFAVCGRADVGQQIIADGEDFTAYGPLGLDGKLHLQIPLDAAIDRVIETEGKHCRVFRFDGQVFAKLRVESSASGCSGRDGAALLRGRQHCAGRHGQGTGAGLLCESRECEGGDRGRAGHTGKGARAVIATPVGTLVPGKTVRIHQISRIFHVHSTG